MTPPVNIWEYRSNFNYDEPLEPDDRRWVDFSEVRGDGSRKQLFRALGVHSATLELRAALTQSYFLFGGHRGAGKSTELRNLAAKLSGAKRFLVIFVDVVKDLNVHNLDYSDVVLLQAKALVETLKENRIEVPEFFLKGLNDWFFTQIERVEKTTASTIATRADAGVGLNLPFIARCFSQITAAISNNASFKDELRREIKNSFAELAEIFNQLLDFARDELKQNPDLSETLLFIIDGTDRLRGEDAHNFFLYDIHQLRQIKANFIYCAPIHILAEAGQIAQNFDGVFRLQMIKLAEKRSNEINKESLAKLAEFIERRLPLAAFADDQILNKLIAASGGHPRDLLRLVNLCFQEIDEAPITEQVAQKAIERLGKEYSRLIQVDDYAELVDIDCASRDHTPVSDITRRLLYDLVLLEYNNYCWQSHPAVRLLPAYQSALADRDKIQPGA